MKPTFDVGKKIRQTTEELGGTLPEDLPTPRESIQQLQRKEQKQIQERSQLSLFEEPEKTDE
jgi:DNA-damage-inducible protein D